MDFEDSIKALRKELGKTQVDIAKALHISVGTVSRWELGLHYPNNSTSVALLEYAKSNGASKECIMRLKRCNGESVKRRQQQYQGDLFSIERSSLEDLVEYVRFPIYVCDIETDELLYLNKIAREMVSDDTCVGKKCYKCIMHLDAPCKFCHKSELKSDEFVTYDAFRPFDGTSYRVQGKLIRWDGHDAQIRCVSNTGQMVTIPDQEDRKQKYEKFLNIKASRSSDCLAMTHINLSRNTVFKTICNLDSITSVTKYVNADKLLDAFKRYTCSVDDQCKYNFIYDMTSMMNMFYIGKTHITIRHQLNIDSRLYETTFDLIQNPITFDIEAVAVMNYISNITLVKEIATVLLELDYETIILIDAVTGETNSITNGYIDDAITEQKALGNNMAGVESFIKKYCFDSDVKRVTFENSLPNVINQLNSKPKFSLIYSLKIGDKISYKRIVYAYLDSTHCTVFCTVQDVSDLYNNRQP